MLMQMEETLEVQPPIRVNDLPGDEIVGFLSSLYYARGVAIKEFLVRNSLVAASLLLIIRRGARRFRLLLCVASIFIKKPLSLFRFIVYTVSIPKNTFPEVFP